MLFFPHYLSLHPGISNASLPLYLKSFEPGTLTVLLTLLPIVINVIYHSRSRGFSCTQLPILFESILALVPRLLLVILALIPHLILAWRFYLNQFLTSCARRFYPDQLHLAILRRRIFYFLCLTILPDQLHLAILLRPILSFFCRAVLPWPTAPADFFLPAVIFMPDSSAPTNCTSRFYFYQFLFLYLNVFTRPVVHLLHLAVLFRLECFWQFFLTSSFQT